MGEKPMTDDARAWLKEKLGEADFAEFEEGLRQGAEAVAKGEVKKEEVEGQIICTGYCNSYCSNWRIQSSIWSSFFVI